MQLHALAVGDGWPLGEALFRCLVLVGFSDAVVGPEPCRFQVIQGPSTWSSMSTCDGVGQVLHGAIARFTGAVVGGRVRR